MSITYEIWTMMKPIDHTNKDQYFQQFRDWENIGLQRGFAQICEECGAAIPMFDAFCPKCKSMTEVLT